MKQAKDAAEFLRPLMPLATTLWAVAEPDQHERCRSRRSSPRPAASRGPAAWSRTRCVRCRAMPDRRAC